MGICDQITFEQLLQPMEALLLNVIYNKSKTLKWQRKYTIMLSFRDVKF